MLAKNFIKISKKINCPTIFFYKLNVFNFSSFNLSKEKKKLKEVERIKSIEKVLKDKNLTYEEHEDYQQHKDNYNVKYLRFN